MILRTVLKDCLYLNWAFPAAALPAPPPPLRYEVHAADGEDLVLGTAVLFRQERLHLTALPALRLSYPQFNLRLCTLDGDGEPSVLFLCLLVPSWVVPAARLVGRQPVQGARFDYPHPTSDSGAEPWRWRVRQRGRLVVAARPGSPAPGSGPHLGSWDKTTAYVSQRRVGYVRSGGELRRLDASHRPAATLPLRAEIESPGLLRKCLPLGGRDWPALHSAWLCPEIPFVFELGLAGKLGNLRRSAGPVAADPAMFGPRQPPRAAAPAGPGSGGRSASLC